VAVRVGVMKLAELAGLTRTMMATEATVLNLPPPQSWHPRRRSQRHHPWPSRLLTHRHQLQRNQAALALLPQSRGKDALQSHRLGPYPQLQRPRPRHCWRVVGARQEVLLYLHLTRQVVTQRMMTTRSKHTPMMTIEAGSVNIEAVIQSSHYVYWMTPNINCRLESVKLRIIGLNRWHSTKPKIEKVVLFVATEICDDRHNLAASSLALPVACYALKPAAVSTKSDPQAACSHHTTVRLGCGCVRPHCSELRRVGLCAQQTPGAIQQLSLQSAV